MPRDHHNHKQISLKKAHTLLLERDAQITALQKEVTALTNRLAVLSKSNHHKKQQQQRRHHPLTPHTVLIQESISKCGANRRQLKQERTRMGRNASIATRKILNALPEDTTDPLAQRIVDMFKDPASNLKYLKSEQFAKDILKLNAKVRPILEEEPRVAFLQSPCYVFGDIHGNLEDLHFFSDNVWRLGMSLTAGNFVFLGDYVDRGMSCLEVVAYLLAMKLLLPQKVFLLRGNHETRDVNGWEEHYGERSFIYQCRERFGDDLGYRVWEQTNQVFDRLPLAAVIDQDIFCVHGGIPRRVSNSESRIQDILSMPKVAGINPPYEHENEAYQQVASDCIWSDPASEEQEACGVDPITGFGESLRGGGAICFGHKAVTDFLQQHGFSYIMRAHEAHAEGVAVSKGARVFTVFSTSKDHNQGSKALAGCILVDFEKMQVINRSPAYRNQYVHRRDSVSIAMLSEHEIKQRIKLGLVTTEPTDGDDDDSDDYEADEWDDFEDDEEESDSDDDSDDDTEEEEEPHYVIATRRSSAVNPEHTVASPPGSSHDSHEQPDFWGSLQNGVQKQIDFSCVSTTNRKKKNAFQLSALNEEDEEEDDEDEDSTLEGNDMDGVAWEETDLETKNNMATQPMNVEGGGGGSSTPAKRSASAVGQNVRFYGTKGRF